MDKTLTGNTLYQLIDHLSKEEKSQRFLFTITLTMYTYFMMEMEDLVRYYQEANSVSGYSFNKTSTIVNEGTYVGSH